MSINMTRPAAGACRSLPELAGRSETLTTHQYDFHIPGTALVAMSTELEMSTDPGTEALKKSKRHSAKEGKKKRKRDDNTESQGLPSKKIRAEIAQSVDRVNVTSTLPDSIEPSPFHIQTSSLYLPLSPITQLYPLKGLCAEHLSPLILTYYPPFRGVLLSYSNVRLSEDPSTSDSTAGKPLARSVDEYAVSFIWVTADFLIFRPPKGGWIEGWVNLQNEGHLGLVCWNLFNASIERKRLPKTWKWIRTGAESVQREQKVTMEQSGSQEVTANGVTEGQGYFEDADGKIIEGRVRFRVRDLESSSSSDKEKGFLSIEGSLLSDQEEAELIARETARFRGSGQSKIGGLGTSGKARMSGALVATPRGNSSEVVDSLRPKKSKHRVG